MNRSSGAPRELLRAVLDMPEKTEPRVVYADALAELGDPRGEFIALDCLQAPTDRQRRRASALSRHHHRAWLAGLEPLADTRWARFDRGFLHTIGLRRTLVDAVSLAPEAQLVREIHVVDEGPGGHPLTAVLRQLGGLRVARGIRLDEWAALEVELEELGVRGAADGLLAAGGRSDGLRRLSAELGTRVDTGRSILRRLSLEHLDVGRAPLEPWIPLRDEVPSLALSGRCWRYTMGGDAGMELTVDPRGSATTATRISDLMATLRTIGPGLFRWVWVRGGPHPGERATRDLRRAVGGTPLRLPATWTRPRDVDG